MGDLAHRQSDINIHIPDDKLSSLLSSLDGDTTTTTTTDAGEGGDRGVSVDSGLARNGSIQSDRMKGSQPMKYDQLFKDRPLFAENDICFPSSPSCHPPPNCPSYHHQSIKQQQQRQQQQYLNQHQQQQQYQQLQPTFDKDALRLFRSNQSETGKQPRDNSEKRLSLYGDGHTLTQPLQDDTPRFTYYHPDTGRLQGKTLFDLTAGCNNTTTNIHSTTIDDLLNKENYWLDITSPSQTEMQAISRIFGIHPLTTEDIINQEIREKCDSFRNYIFVCYRAFVHDDLVLKPICFYNVVFKQHLLTIHFGKVPHIDYVQQRVGQLQAYIKVVPDWINYALVDEVTDSFAPLIHQIEHEVESLDDIVLHSPNSTAINQTEMVSRIGFCRKRVMQMLRLLSSKSDVIRALIKRFDERSPTPPLQLDHQYSLSQQLPPPSQQQQQQHQHYHYQQQQEKQQHQHQQQHYHQMNKDNVLPVLEAFQSTENAARGGSFSSNTTLKSSPMNTMPPPSSLHQDLFDSPVSLHTKKGSYSQAATWIDVEEDGRILPDVGLYLGDVQDHIVTMLQNLNHYETLLARTHTNYLAKISIELTQTSNSTNLVIGRLTIFATILLPMNLITGLWGMNVKVPGGDFDNLAYFFWIVCSLAAFAVFALTLARKWELF
ncbi:unnamed protein product [Absidia cylindrospora]